jgi:fucose permease
MMQEPSSGNPYIYVAIAGVAALLCFALLLTGSVWLTMAVMMLGFLHLAQYFPSAEAIISEDPVLLWLRRVSPLIILGIFGIVLVGNWLY